MCPERCKRNGGNDEFEGACSIYLDMRLLANDEQIKIIVSPCLANHIELRVVHLQEVYEK